jgi:hypothetical protein
MEGHHWIMLVVIALVFYVIGAKFPGTAQRFGF